MAEEHYDEAYYKWQSGIGRFGGWANLDKFAQYIRESDCVLDFGSGGGFLLQHIRCREKTGIEINESARKEAERLGIHTVVSASDVPDNWADIIISNHALEHTTHPLDILRSLYTKLKQGGKIVFVVPCESFRMAYHTNDTNHHLYTWSPMCLGNLFSDAGYRVIESRAYIHRWPPYYEKIASLFGRRVFNLCCRVYGRMSRTLHQVRIIAEKPA